MQPHTHNFSHPATPQLARPTMRPLHASLALAALLLSCFPTPGHSQAICAEVKIKLSQELALTRTAFTATLVINNGTSGLLEHLDIDLDIRDLAGQPMGQVFSIPAPSLSGISDVDGGGFLVPGDSGQIQWLLTPLDLATPAGQPVGYTIGGTVVSVLDGVPQVVDLFPAPITVFPDASLELDYYLQTKVYADNPFTPLVIEDSEPFNLGVIVRNLGAGPAKNLTITQKQPEYLDNPQGLALDVKVVAAEACGQALSSNLTLQLGQLEPDAYVVARWLLESNLLGTLKDLSISWKHLKATGEEGLALIESVELHAATHLVDASEFGNYTDPADACADFLVDSPSLSGPFDPVTGAPASDYPDEIHLSTGGVEPVLQASSWLVDGVPDDNDLAIEIELTVASAGWHYLRIEDPANGLFELAQVSRLEGSTPRASLSVGGPGDLCAAWTTARPIDLTGDLVPDDVRDQLHLVDYLPTAGTFRYELTYIPLPTAPLTAVSDIVSVSQGGVQQLLLNGGAENAFALYVLLGSFAGTAPGFSVDGTQIPLNIDTYFITLLSNPTIQSVFGAVGFLNQAGEATAQIIVPPGSGSFQGALVYHAFALVSAVNGVYFASNPVPLYLIQ